MQTDPSAPSSDLEKARSISRRLRGPRAQRSRETAAPRFQTPAAAPMQDETPVSADLLEDECLTAMQPDNFGSRFWNELLCQCMEVAQNEGGTAAFAVDGQGLCIGQVGGLDSEEVEGTGSRLVIAMEQASRMETFSDRRAGSILIEFGDQWLTGFAIQCTNDTSVVLGIIARDPLAPRSRDRVSNLVTELLTGPS